MRDYAEMFHRVQLARLDAMRQRNQLAVWTDLHPKPHYVLHVVNYGNNAACRHYLWWRVEWQKNRFTGWYRSPALAFERMQGIVT